MMMATADTATAFFNRAPALCLYIKGCRNIYAVATAYSALNDLVILNRSR
jgi:hypothetical protein